MRSFHDETLSHFDEIYRRLDRLESEYQALAAAVKRLEVAFAEDRASRKGMESEIEKLKVQIADLQERLARLEHDSHDASAPGHGSGAIRSPSMSPRIAFTSPS